MVSFFAVVHILVLLAVAMQVYRKQSSLRKYFWPALLFKLISGVCLGLVYTYYYSRGDTFVYFGDASKVAALARTDISSYLQFLFSDHQIGSLQLGFSQPRAAFLTKITSVFSLLTRDNYWITGLYFSFLSFLGAWSLVQVIDRNIPSTRVAALIAFLFLPSVVFWTSGLLKESLSMAALCVLSAIFLKIWFREKVSGWNYMVAALCLWILWNLKYYYAGAFIAIVFANFIYRILIKKSFSFSPGVEALVWILILVAPTAIVSTLHPNFHFDRILDVIASNNRDFLALSTPDRVINFHDLRATPLSILWNAPWALFSGLFRPLFWEASSIIQFLPGVENTLLLLLFAGSVLRFKSYLYSPHRLLTFSLMIYVIVLCVFLTLSAPNFGTLSRYRTGYISFFTFIILCNNPILGYVERSLRRRLVRK